MNKRKLTCAAALLFTFHAAPSFAYIDPGTGAYVVQSLIALGGAVLFYLTRPAALIALIKQKLWKRRERS
ncbi:MAG: hypothetical protein WDO56_21250 [Gammaproteobacteria bacterium]